MNLLIRLKTILPILVTLACFGLSPGGRAVNPPPDGGYPNGNTAEGTDALFNLTTGGANTATGSDALFNNTTGSHNTANGEFSLLENRTGDDNTATGFDALFRNTIGSNNTATGSDALLSNTTGSDNTANGFAALHFNTTGEDNTAIGKEALEFNTTGFGNTANGFQALLSNTTGAGNTASGFKALVTNTTGFDNTATGALALGDDTTGAGNTANGAFALGNNTTGASNTANGFDALDLNTTGHDNLAEGYSALESNTTGSSNIAIGSQAGSNLTTGSNNIDIGAPGNAGESNTIRIGRSGTQRKTFIAGIRGATVANGVGVIVGTTGQLGTVVSSARFKEAIKPMNKASEAILALKPVTFRYKKELDPDKIPQFGLIAEEVEKVNPGLVARDEEGKIMSVRYEAVNAMLLNEFLKEHKAVQQQGQTIALLEKELETVTATLRKVSAQLELSKPAPQTVLNEQ